ncbi:MAG TPA: RNA-binding domain-containing protein [Kofleriaceae bacterium]|nr:RNA-binding domain-containing protein [Kofleriaceae bacterium]
MTLLPVRLDDLIHARTVEPVRIDFKASWNDVSRAATVQTIAAFANDFQGLNGGYVVLGIEDSGGQPVLPPRGLDGLDLERVQKEIRGGCERISPAYQPIILPEVFDGKPIIVIYAPMGDARPYQAPEAIGKGAPLAYYVRIGAETHVARGAVLTQLHQLTARVPFDERRRSDVPLAKVSPRLLARYLHDVGRDLAAEADTIDVRDVLRRLRLSGGLNGTEGPRNAALLFFTESPEDIFSGCRIELAQFRDDAGGDLIETRSFRGPIQHQTTQVLDFLSSLFGEVVRKGPDDAQAARLVAYPSKALREAIVNAVYHRGYEGGSLPIRVGLYPDRVEVTSYPGPVPGVLAEHLLPGAHPPQVPARNPLVGEMLKALRLAETWHTGIPKIHRAMIENGSPVARFDFDEGRTYFRVTLPAHPGYIVLHALREAAVLWHTGDRQRAIAVVREASAKVPEAGSLTAQEIDYLAASGDLPEARKAFQQLEQVDGAHDRHLAYMALARAYLDADLRGDAAALLASAPLPTTPAQVELAILHKRSRDFEAAHRRFSSIAGQIQTDPRALHEWAQTKIALADRIAATDDVGPTARQQLLREAQDLLARVTELSHDQPLRAASAWFDIAKVRASLQAPEASIQDAATRALRLNPGDPEIEEWRRQRRTD